MISLARIVSIVLGATLTVAAAVATPAVAVAAPVSVAPTYFDASTCSGVEGVASNIGGAMLGVTVAPILFRPQLGTPYLDGNVVRADSTISFKSVGSCMAQVSFQMQTKTCGRVWSCGWEVRNHGTWEYLWKHSGDGYISGTVAMTCRPGTHSYQVHMAVVGPVSVGEEPKDDFSGGQRGAALGVDATASASQSSDGPAVKLTCPSN